MLISHSAIYLLARGLPGAVNLLAIVVFTRLLAPDDYGRYALVLSTVALLNVLFFQWLRLSLGRFFPAAIKDPGPLVATVLALFGMVALAVGLLGTLALAAIADPAWRQLVVIVVALLWAQAWFDLTLAMAVARLQPARYGWLLGAKALLALIAGTLFVLWGQGARGPLFGLLIALTLAGIAGARGRWAAVGLRIDRARVREIARYGLPLATTLLLGYVVSTSDRFLLAALVDTRTAGLYAAAFDLGTQGLTALMMVVNLAGNPLMVRALEFHGVEMARRQARHSASLLLAVAVPTAGAIALLAPDIAGVVIGAEFASAATSVLPIVSLAALLAGLRAYYFDLAFQLGRWTVGQAWIVGAAALLNIALNLWWIPLMGFTGAAWAAVAAYALALAFSILLGRRSFPLPFPWAVAWRVMLAVAVMLAAMGLIPGEAGPTRLALRALVGGAVFATAAAALGLVGLLKSAPVPGLDGGPRAVPAAAE